jgi:hypothetical protein
MRSPSRRRTGSEQGIALVIALMAMMLMAALGSALVLMTMTEAGVSSNYVSGVEAFYAADAALERTLSDLPAVGDWNSLIGLRFDGPVEALMPTATTSPMRIVVSIAPAEVELAIVVRAQASGPQGVERAVEAIVARTAEVGPAGIRVLAWREGR